MNLILATLFLLFCDIVLSDCGCNKLNRDSNELDSELKKPELCSADSGSSIRNWIHELHSDDNEMSLIPGGDYYIGTDTPVFVADHESPERKVFIEEFFLDKFEVSNGNFIEFIDSTGYVTEAEKFGDSFVFQQHLSEQVKTKNVDFRVLNAEWWYKISGSNWKHPKGPESDIKGLENYPVTHVSWNDAVSYCEWKHKRLPTESEWEVACRGGKKGKLFPWGNKIQPKKEHW